ncbi:Protein FAR1-RELATED SEQUENCE 5, partial [Striga hermonthica]
NMDNVGTSEIPPKDKQHFRYKSEWIDDLDVDGNHIKEKMFESEEEAGDFYNFYAKCTRFSIRKDDVRRNKSSGMIDMRKWVCSKEGFRDKKWLEKEDISREPRPLTRVGCPAVFRVKYNKRLKKFVVTEFVKKHNHELMTEEGVSFLFSHQSVKESDLVEAISMHEVGWRTSEIMNFFAHRAGGYHKIGFTLKDLYNSVYAKRKADIRDGDAEGALAYFSAKKDSDPSFFFKFDVDESNRLRHLIWVESRCQSDYQYFGDVLVFDTTYRTNAYRKPLVILAGVNNHYMTTIFGAALLSDETEETYVWVLETFVAAMGGKKPISVITDGDNSMRLAIENVLPEARHRLCSWHLQRNAAVNVHSTCFCQAFYKCMDKICSKEEFERSWKDCIQKQQVENNSWVNETYSKRSKWAEAYLRGHFFGNMKCTQRCEGYGELCDTIARVTNRMHEIYSNSCPSDNETDASKKNEKHQFGVRDPIITKTKGSSGLHSKQRPRRCRKCRLPGHNKTTCPKMKSREDDKDSLDFDTSGEDNSQDQSSFHASSRRGYHSCEYANSSHVNEQPNAFPTSNQYSGNDLSFQCGSSIWHFQSNKHQNGEKGFG